MTETYRGRSPTSAQLDYCALLGIEVPVLATRQEVSLLIDRKKVIVASAVLKESGIRTGSVIRRADDDGHVYVVTEIRRDFTCVRRIPDDRGLNLGTVTWGGRKANANLINIFTPDIAWIHPFAIKTERVQDEASSRYDRRRKALRDYIDMRIAPGDRENYAYGEYWRRKTVDDLAKEFAAAHD